MEVISILIGIIFWPTAIAIWCVYCRKRKPSRLVQQTGLLLVIGTPLLAVASMSKYMFLDEPLFYAVQAEDIAKVKLLLAWGADPNVSIHNRTALEEANAEGQIEIVRLLHEYRAHSYASNTSNFRDPVDSAQHNTSSKSPRLANPTRGLN